MPPVRQKRGSRKPTRGGGAQSQVQTEPPVPQGGITSDEIPSSNAVQPFQTGTNTLLSQDWGFTPMPVNSVQFSLGHNVNEMIRQKIVEGKYVDLALLLKNSNIEDSASERIFLIGNDGQMQSKLKNTLKITSIEKWTDAFLIYLSVFTSVHTSKYQDMLKYMHDVRTGAGRSSGWKIYDEQFRLKLAMDPTKSWSAIDTELWVMYMVGGHNMAPAGVQGVNKCYMFNFQGFCGRKHCTYAHLCIKCSQEHAMTNCPLAVNVNKQAPSFSPKQPLRQGPQQGSRPAHHIPQKSPRFAAPRPLGARFNSY